MPNEQSAFPMFHLHFGLGQKDECEPASLYLPANHQQIKKALDSIDSCCLDECVCHSLSGRIGQVADGYRDMGQFNRLNLLAFQAVELEKQGLFLKYEAMIEATGCVDIEDAIELAGQMEEYFFTPDVHSCADVAREELGVILCDKDAEFITGSLDLEDYGARLMQRDNLRLTSGGLLARADHEPIPDLGPPGSEQEQNQEQDTTEYQQTM